MGTSNRVSIYGLIALVSHSYTKTAHIHTHRHGISFAFIHAPQKRSKILDVTRSWRASLIFLIFTVLAIHCLLLLSVRFDLFPEIWPCYILFDTLAGGNGILSMCPNQRTIPRSLSVSTTKHLSILHKYSWIPDFLCPPRPTHTR